MRKRSAIATVAALGTMLFAATMLGGASADAATAAPAAPSPQPPSSCSAVYFDIELGQGVDVFCNQAPATYQAMAQCDNGFQVWWSVGTVTVANSAPSVALCRGELLAPAQIISYYVVE